MTRTVACQSCGEVLQDTDRFCARCGASNATLADRAAPAERAPSVWDLVGDALRAATRGEFDIGGELGHGGMAAVYLAHDIALDKKVAIKVMAPTLMADRSMLERFLQEARTVAKLEHPHIVTVHAARQANGLNFFIMKFVQGLELEAVLQRVGALPLAVTRAILFEVASALQYAHDRDVIHRDVKPSNIMIDTAGKAFVTDFGIAKLKGGKGLTVHGAAIGTPQYMSPEQCMAGPVSAASDQYSLGVVAYHMLAGAPPFNGEPLTVMRAQVDDPPPQLDRLIDGPCPSEVRAALERMLAKDQGARWPGVLQAVQALGGHPLAANDPVRAEIVRLVKTPDFIPPTAMFTTPLSPSPALSRAEPAPPAVGPVRPTTPIVPVAPVERAAPRTAALPVFDALHLSGAPRAIAPGASFALRAVLRSRNGPSAPATGVEWESSEPQVATVDRSGRVRAVGPGGVTISASAQGLRASVQVTVRIPRPIPWRLIGRAAAGLAAVVGVTLVVLNLPHKPAGQLRIEPNAVSLIVGGEAPLALQGAPAGASPLWRSSDTMVVRVDNTGRLAGVGPGTADVVAQVADDQVRVTVRVDRVPVRVASVRLTPSRGGVVVGRTVRLSADVFDPAGKPIADRSVAWRSSDPATASVSSEGVVGGVAPGSVQIVAAVEGVEAVAEINVSAPKSDAPPPPLAVMTVVVSPAEVGLSVGQTRALTASPRDRQGRPLERAMTWRSEDDAIARVSEQGVVVGVGPGRAQVVATSEGVSGSAIVTVDAPASPPPPPAATIVVAEVAAGGRHTCARSERGQVWCWGDNAAGQVRVGAGAAVAQPASLESRQVASLVAGGAHTCGLRDGQATCWGSNAEGQLGSGDRNAREATLTGRRFTALTAGADHTCGVTSDGAVLCWGKNEFGQLGDRSTTKRTTPTPIAASGPFISVAAGARHTCALHRDGRLFCWGDNWSGQVGSSMTQAIPEPTQIGAALRFTQVAAGQEHTCAVTREGRINCWGQNNEGQLGDGSKRAHNAPAPIGLSETFATLAAGGLHTCGLTRDGRAFCWGRGQDGQLGSGTPAGRPTPTAVRTTEEFVVLAAGERHTCGVTRAGLVLCWGANARGQLGTGGSAASLVPSPVAELAP